MYNYLFKNIYSVYCFILIAELDKMFNKQNKDRNVHVIYKNRFYCLSTLPVMAAPNLNTTKHGLHHY